MYFLLIEAAGLRQASKLHPAWHAEFLSGLTQSLKKRHFKAASREGNLLLFRDASDSVRQPEKIAEILRSLAADMAGHHEYLLDFVILVDYREEGDDETMLTLAERYLRHAREHNSVYITEPVALALEPIVELADSGSIFRVLSFRDEYGLSAETYHHAVPREETVRVVSDTLKIAGKRNCWFVTSDISGCTAAYQAASGDQVLVLDCAQQGLMPVLLELMRSMAAILDIETLFSEGEHSEVASHAVDLVRRFVQPGHRYLPTPYTSGELQYAAAQLLISAGTTAGTTAGTRVTIVLEGVDQGSWAAADVVASNFPGRTVVITREAPDEVVPEDERDRSVRWILRHMSGAGDESAFHYWSGLGGSTEHDGTAQDTSFVPAFVPVLRRILGPKHRCTLFVVDQAASLLPSPLLDEFFLKQGITRAELTRIVKDLLRTGLLVNEGVPAVHRLIKPVVISVVGSDADEYLRQLRRFIIDKLEIQSVFMSPWLWELIRDGVRNEEEWKLHHEIVHTVAAGGSFALFYRYGDTTGRDAKAVQLNNASARLRLYLRDSRGPDECVETFNVVRRLLDTVSLPIEQKANIHLSIGEYFLARREYPAALDTVKRAVMLQQELEDGSSRSREANSYLLMARIMFAQRRLTDAGRYLGFATEQAGPVEETVLVARSLEAIRLFLVGNLSRGLRTLEQQLSALLEYGLTDWYLLLRFLRGRTFFELGEYHQAVQAFEEVREYCDQCGITGPVDVATRWSLRSRYAVDGTGEKLRKELDLLKPGSETLFFIAESWMEEKRFNEALPYLEQAISLEESVDRWPRLSVCWDDGFASIEDTMIADRQGASELLRILNAFYAWTLSHIGRQDEAVPIFYALTRGSDRSVLDPYTGLYSYLYSSVLPDARSGDRDDRATVLGRSVKLIQERTSRIDEYAHKLQFQKQNRWNRRLMEVARRYNLV